MHDTSHKSMYKSSSLDEFFGKWFGGYPIWNDMLRFRKTGDATNARTHFLGRITIACNKLESSNATKVDRAKELQYLKII